MSRSGDDRSGDESSWDHSTKDEFYAYYAEASANAATRARFEGVRDSILEILRRSGRPPPQLVADIGCGAGTFSAVWAERGFETVGIDVNAPLVELARTRAREAGANSRFEVGSATELPLESGSVDVCVAPELLEHVADWQACLDEFARILRPGGALFLSTTNKLCPKQQEFNLPFYGWYPAPLKRHFEQLARTTRPALANHATYPAVNWFTFAALRRELADRGFDRFHDKFDMSAAKGNSGVKKFILNGIRLSPAFRWLAHVATEGVGVVAIKSGVA